MFNNDLSFAAYSHYKHTCGFCGSVFLVELERPKSYKDTRPYRCPSCGHACSARTSTDPRVTLISGRTDGRTGAHPKADLP